MDDLISRQAAINALMPIYKSASLRNRNVFSTARKCMATIEELPPAQPERGRWIKMNGDRGYECSRCGWESDTTWDFCPNCGALNIEVRENTDEVEEK